jgi:hypothetical protein
MGQVGVAEADNKDARRRAVAQRVVVTLGLVVLFCGVGLLMLGGTLSGFARPVWMPIAGLTSIPLFLILVGIALILKRKTPLAVSGTATPGYFGQVPRFWLSALGTLPLIVGLVLILMSLQVSVPALALGSHPERALAQDIVLGRPCGSKCNRPVWVQFRTLDGVTVVARLAGADGGLEDGDGPGRPLVFDPTKPSRVMRESDWADGRGVTSAALAGGGVVVLATLIFSMVLTIRRRRRVFGGLKPGVTIVRVRSKRVRSGLAWRVDFADHSRATYADGDRIRPALLERLIRGALAEISDQDRSLLSAPFNRRGR